MHFTLKKRVTVEGPNFFGLPAWVSFDPITGGESDPTWCWRTMGGKSVPLDATLLDRGDRKQLELTCGTDKLHKYEHFGALRFLLAGVEIRTAGFPSSFGPYDGCASLVWTALTPHLVPAYSSRKWYTPATCVRWTYPELRTGQEAFTEIIPGRAGWLRIVIRLSFEKFGDYEREYLMFVSGHEHRELMEKFLSAKAPNFSPGLRLVSKFTPRFLWPHHQNIFWPNGVHSAEEILEAIARHRALDLLGALSLLCGDGMLCGTVVSQCSGHLADFHVVKEAGKTLRLV